MKRTVIGNLFGQTGMYVSQPGDDLDSPTKSLLLDSRFAGTRDVHFTERVRLNTASAGSNLFRYFIVRSFPALGYSPQYFASLILFSSDTVTYPMGAQRVHGRTVNTFELNVNSNTIEVDMDIGGASMTLDVFYVIYKNPR